MRHESLPTSPQTFSFWQSVTDMANQFLWKKLSVYEAHALAKNECTNPCQCGLSMKLFNPVLDNGPLFVPDFDNLEQDVIVVDPDHDVNIDLDSLLNTDEATVTQSDFASASHRSICLNNFAAPAPAPAQQLHQLPPPTASAGVPSKLDLATRLASDPNFPRSTLLVAIQHFRSRTYRTVWMDESLKNKLDALQHMTPPADMEAFIRWRLMAEKNNISFV